MLAHMGVVKTVEWVPVESTVFTAAAYRRDARQLYLRFDGGTSADFSPRSELWLLTR